MNDRNKINICQDKKVNDAANKYFILFKIFILVYLINKALSHKGPSYRHSEKKMIIFMRVRTEISREQEKIRPTHKRY